jgi:hypothetical protein
MRLAVLESRCRATSYDHLEASDLATVPASAKAAAPSQTGPGAPGRAAPLVVRLAIVPELPKGLVPPATDRARGAPDHRVPAPPVSGLTSARVAVAVAGAARALSAV